MALASRGANVTAAAPCLRLASPHASVHLVRRNRCRLHAVEDAVDPYTGEVISSTSSMNTVAGYKVDAGGMTWAYRRSAPKQPDAAKLPVLLLHGLGGSSYSFRRTLAMLGDAGFDAIAPDWPGHGDSAKPPASAGFDYGRDAYLSALDAFVKAVGIKQPYALVVQGYVLGQFGLLHALQHEEQVERLFILNTPLARSTKLRPELAAYKAPLPFMRPGSRPFDGAAFAAAGTAYAMGATDAAAYARPYEDAAASAAIAATMDALDFPALLREVDDGFQRWRKPSVLLFGGPYDPWLNAKSAFEFLDSKRTNMRLVTASAKLGHMPQEDYPEAIQETLELFLSGQTDNWEPGRVVAAKMTKAGPLM